MWCVIVRTGVSSVAIQVSEKDQLLASGEGVDSANLTRSLRKKLCYATILSVEEVKENAEDKDASASDTSCSVFPAYYQPFPKYYPQVVYDPYPNNCSIM
jgi:hypothetical protein